MPLAVPVAQYLGHRRELAARPRTEYLEPAAATGAATGLLTSFCFVSIHLQSRRYSSFPQSRRSPLRPPRQAADQGRRPSVRASLPCVLCGLLVCFERFVSCAVIASLLSSLLFFCPCFFFLPATLGPSCDKRRTLSSTTFPRYSVSQTKGSVFSTSHTTLPGASISQPLCSRSFCEPLISRSCFSSIRPFLNSPQSILLAFSSYFTLFCRFYSLLFFASLGSFVPPVTDADADTTID